MDQQIQQPYNPSSDVVVQPIPTGHDVGTSQQIRYNQKTAKILGGTQILIGIVHVVLNVYVFFSYSGLNFLRFTGYGIWGGSLFIIAGVLQILSGKNALNMCLITGTLVMCVISACACGIGFSFGIIEASSRGYFTLSKALASLVAVLSFAEGAISIVSSAMCCNSICRLKPDMTAVPVHTAGNQKVSHQANNPVVYPFGSYEKSPAPQV